MPRSSLKDKVKALFRGQKRAYSASPHLEELSRQHKRQRPSLRRNTIDPTEPSTSRPVKVKGQDNDTPDMFRFNLSDWPEKSISASSSSPLACECTLAPLGKIYQCYVSGCDRYQKASVQILESIEDVEAQHVHPVAGNDASAATTLSSEDFKDAIEDGQSGPGLETLDRPSAGFHHSLASLRDERQREKIIQSYMRQFQDDYPTTGETCEKACQREEDKSAQVSITLNASLAGPGEEQQEDGAKSDPQASKADDAAGSEMSIRVENARIELREVSTQAEQSSSKTRLVIVGQPDRGQGVTVNIAEKMGYGGCSSATGGTYRPVRNMPINISGQNVYINIRGTSYSSSLTCRDSTSVTGGQNTSDFPHSNNVLDGEDNANVYEHGSEQALVSDTVCDALTSKTEYATERCDEHRETGGQRDTSVSLSHEYYGGESQAGQRYGEGQIHSNSKIAAQSSGLDYQAELSTTLSGVVGFGTEGTGYLTLDDILRDMSDVQLTTSNAVKAADDKASHLTENVKARAIPCVSDEDEQLKGAITPDAIETKPVKCAGQDEDSSLEITALRDVDLENHIASASSTEGCPELLTIEVSSQPNKSDGTAVVGGAGTDDVSAKSGPPSEAGSQESITLRVERLTSDSLSCQGPDHDEDGQLLDGTPCCEVLDVLEMPEQPELSISPDLQQNDTPCKSEDQTPGHLPHPIIQITDVDQVDTLVSVDDSNNDGMEVDDRVSDDSGLVDVYKLTREAQYENYQLMKSYAKYRSRSAKIARLHQYLEQLRGEREEMKNLLASIDRQTAALRNEAAEMRCTVTAVCDMSVAAIGKETEARRLEPACYRRYLNIRNPSDASNALSAVRNRIKALNDLEVLIYRKQLVLHHVLPSSAQEKTSVPKRVYRPAHRGPKPKRSDASATSSSQLSTGNIIIEVVSPVAEPRTPSWSEEASHTESPSISTPLSVSNEVTGSAHHLPDTEV